MRVRVLVATTAASLLCASTVAVAQLNPLWFGTWKSVDGTATVKISATKLIHSFEEKHEDGRRSSKTVELDWSSSDGGEPGQFGYSAERTSPEKISEGYEKAVRQFKEDPTDYMISDPATSRQAIAAISPGVYRVLWSYDAGDCGGWDYILDKDRMLEFTECKYGFVVMLYNRVK